MKLAATVGKTLNKAKTVPASVLTQFSKQGLPLAKGAKVTAVGTGRWLLSDAAYDRRYLVVSLEPAEKQLAVYHESPVGIAQLVLKQREVLAPLLTRVDNMARERLNRKFR